MSDAAEALSLFLPRSVVAHLASLPGAPSEPREQLLEAAVMLADVSGFTALAERLARAGPSGAELLTRTLNAFFDPLIERIHASGGDVLKFAGDAMVVQWPVGAGGPALAAQRAAACGLALQAYAEDPTREGERLRLKVAVGLGSLRLHHIGGWRGRWEVLITGEGLSSLASVTPLAKPGEVVLTEEAKVALGPSAEVKAVGEGAFVLESVATPPSVTADPSRALPSIELLSGYLPEAVTAGGIAGSDQWLSELRPVTAVFINFPNATFRTPLERSHGIMLALQQTLDRYEGTANKISVDEKGVSVVAVFGTPPNAHPDDPARAVLAARSIQQQLAAKDVKHAIGIASGMAFCGVVGGASRREYTVLGDTVNLAARLMQAAKGDLFCDAATAQRASARLNFDALPPLTVKGKAEPVPAFRPGAELEAGIQELTPLLGRVAELEAIRQTVAAARSGSRPPPLLLEAEAGLGKSRLMAEAERLCDELGLSHLAGAGDPLERDTPYFAWRSILEHLLQLPGAGQERKARAEAYLANHGFTEVGPLLNPLLGLDLAETPATLELSGPVRGENTRELLVKILILRSEQGPVALLIEDAHWLDGASWSLALLARQRAPHLLLVLTSRPPEPPELVERKSLLAEARRLVLGPLAPEEAVALACQRLQVRSLPEEVAQVVRERGGGHPYFSEELAYALRDSGILRFEDGEASLVDGRSIASLELPPSIQGVITQRVDRLPSDLKVTLKTASVIGRTFSLSVLRAVHPARLDAAALDRQLEELARLDLTPVEAKGQDRTYAFKHALTREAVYGTVLVATRREVHAAVAGWYEQEAAATLNAHAALLAHHWIQAEEADKGRRYLEVAGEQALGSGAPREAVTFLEDAVAREPATGDSPLARARRRRLWGEALLDCGRLIEARVVLDQAVSLLGWPMPQARPRWALSLMGHAARQLTHRFGRANAQGTPDREAEAEGARIYARLGQVCFFQNQPEGTLFSTLAAVNLAEAALPARERVRAYADLTIGCSLLPAPGLARSYERLARAALEEHPRLADEGWARLILGMVHGAQGDWPTARRELERSRELEARLGDVRRHSEGGMILSVIDWLTGDLAAAKAIVEATVAAGRRAADVHMQSGSNVHLGYCLLREGEVARAREHLEEGAKHAAAAGAVPEQVYAHGMLAIARVEEGRPTEARDELDRVIALLPGLLPTAVYAIEGYGAAVAAALALAETDRTQRPRLDWTLGGLSTYARTFPIAQPRLLRYQGRQELLRGRPREGAQKFAASLRRATELVLPVDITWAHFELGRAGPEAERGEHTRLAIEGVSRVGTQIELQRVTAGQRGPVA